MTKQEIQKLANQHKKAAKRHDERVDLSKLLNNNELASATHKIEEFSKKLELSKLREILLPHMKVALLFASTAEKRVIELSWAHFEQGEFAKRMKIDGNICTVLVPLWYAKLSEDNHLLDILKSDNCNNIVVDINHMIKNTYWWPLPTLKNDDHKKNEAAPKINEMVHPTGYLADYLNSEKADTQLFICEKNNAPLVSYFEQLERQDKECVGLHMMVYKSESNTMGHTIGWTALEEHYLVFDSNSGEKIFENYQDLKDYICNEQFSNIKDESYGFTVADFYSELDLEVLNTSKFNNHRPI